LLSGLAGCRLNIDSARENTPVAMEKLVTLEVGTSSLDDVLRVVGAPDGVMWVDSESVLVYESVRIRATHWTLDNPVAFAQRVTPQGFAGELVSMAIFTVGGMNRRLPTRPPPNRPMPEATPEIMGAFGKPLKLNGDKRGDDQVRFHFEPKHQRLCQVEMIHAQPGSGSAAIAENTFLR
jgi:hypothetical protein